MKLMPVLVPDLVNDLCLKGYMYNQLESPKGPLSKISVKGDLDMML